MSEHLTRSRARHVCTIYDNNTKKAADVYSCNPPIHMTMRNPGGHVAEDHNHGLGSNPGQAVSEQTYNMIFVMRNY